MHVDRLWTSGEVTRTQPNGVIEAESWTALFRAGAQNALSQVSLATAVRRVQGSSRGSSVSSVM